MSEQKLEHILAMEKIIAQTRLAVVLLVGAALLNGSVHLAADWRAIAAIWTSALAYAAVVVLAEPYRRLPVTTWEVASGCCDWGLITVGIIVTGGANSELHILYFLSVLSVALRFGLREVLIAAVGTIIGYFGVVLATASAWPHALQDAGLRMGLLMMVALGSGLLARAANRQLRARVREHVQRLAVQDVTATVCHDLTNPLMAVAGLVDILLGSAADSLSLEQRGLLHRINANVQQMAGLVGNLLDAELIERGQQPFRPAPLDLNALVRRVVETQAHQAEVKQIGLVLDLSARLPLAILDGHMMERLVANLLGNAVKFTPENGAIRVSTRQQESRVVVEVWNSGSELLPSLQSLLFEKFVHGEDSPGIGLGLYICKSIVEAHRGRIAARNSTNGGVTFVAELPIAASALVELQASTKEPEARNQRPRAMRLSFLPTPGS